MRKPVVNHHKAHMSHCLRLNGPAAPSGRQRSPRGPRTAAAASAKRPGACLAFAGVSPGFFAACIVEAVAGAGGCPATPGAVAAASRAGRPLGGARAGAAREPCRWLRRCGRGSRATGHGHPCQDQQNGQIDHFSRAATRLRKGVRRGAAITPRERTDVRDLLLTTLSSESCVQSSIFGFVAT
jgi:hypothetical protein